MLFYHLEISQILTNIYLKKAKVLNEGFSYNSRDNKSFLNVNEIQKILKREKFI